MSKSPKNLYQRLVEVLKKLRKDNPEDSMVAMEKGLRDLKRDAILAKRFFQEAAAKTQEVGQELAEKARKLKEQREKAKQNFSANDGHKNEKPHPSGSNFKTSENNKPQENKRQ